MPLDGRAETVQEQLHHLVTQGVNLLDQGIVIVSELYPKVVCPAALGPGVGDVEGGEVQQVHGLVLAPFPSSLINGHHLHHQGQLDDVPRLSVVTHVLKSAHTHSS